MNQLPTTTARRVNLRCTCGKLEGALHGSTQHPAGEALRPSNHFVCLCDDCQTYAQWLGRADILDANGGTEVVQVMPRQLQLDAGREHLRCVRLSPQGMYRWYAGCCNTPIANTLGPGSPFAGVVASCLTLDEAAKTRTFGPIKERVYGKFGKGPLPEGTSQKASLRFLVTTLPRISWWWLRGGGRQSPFFFSGGAPVVEPQIARPSE